MRFQLFPALGASPKGTGDGCGGEIIFFDFQRFGEPGIVVDPEFRHGFAEGNLREKAGGDFILDEAGHSGAFQQVFQMGDGGEVWRAVDEFHNGFDERRPRNVYEMRPDFKVAGVNFYTAVNKSICRVASCSTHQRERVYDLTGDCDAKSLHIPGDNFTAFDILPGQFQVGASINEQWVFMRILSKLLFLAFSMFLVATAASGDTAENSYSNGIANLKNGDLNAALNDFNNAIQIEPNLAKAYCARGVTMEKKGNPHAAMEDYDRCIRLDQTLFRAYANRGVLRARAGDLDGAIADFTKGIQLTNMAGLYLNRAMAKQNNKNLDGAIEDFDHAIKLKPDYGEAYEGLGAAMVYKGYLDAALNDFNKAILLNPMSPDFYFNRGSVRQARKDFAGAIADYNRAIQLNPEFAKAYCARGDLKQLQGNLADSIDDYAKAISLNSQYAEAYSDRGIVEVMRSDFSDALADFNRAIDIKPDAPIFYANRGILKAKMGNAQEAAADFSKAIKLNPNMLKMIEAKGYSVNGHSLN